MTKEKSVAELLAEVSEIIAAGLSHDLDGSLVTEPLTGVEGYTDGPLSGIHGHSGGSMKVQKEFEYSPTNSWATTNPYTMAFVYPKDAEPFIVKGGYIDVKIYMEKEKRPAIVHYVLWHNKMHRRIITAINCGKVNIGKKGSGKQAKWEVTVAKVGLSPYKVVATMRKLPRKWIKELDDYTCVKAEENAKGFRRIIL
jgi:hypothetical protein